jgi:hypothetical protein
MFPNGNGTSSSGAPGGGDGGIRITSVPSGSRVTVGDGSDARLGVDGTDTLSSIAGRIRRIKTP